MTASGAAQTANRSRYRAYGVELACEFPLPVGIQSAHDGAAGTTVVARARPVEVVEALWSGGGETIHEAVLAGGTRVSVERGAEGDHLVRYGAHPFHFAAGLGSLTCPPPPASHPEWQHALLDWIAYSTAALAGVPCIHAAAVVDAGGRAVAIAGPTGAGKTTLAGELARGGAAFLSDDVLALELDGERVLGHPGPPFARVSGERWDLVETLGAPRGLVDEEVFVQVEGTAREPAAVAAVVILDRHPHGPASPRLRAAPFFSLRQLAIGFPGPHQPERRRFAVLGALAGQAELLRLEARPTASSESLAGAVRDRLGEGIAR